MSLRRQDLASLILIGTLVSCSPDATPVAPNVPPSFSHTGIPDIAGQVLGEDAGGNVVGLCTLLPPGSLLQLRPIIVGSSTILPTVNLNCPTDTYVIPVNPGTYQIRVTLPPTTAIGSFPFRYLEPSQIVVTTADVTQDVTVRPGIPVLGGGTIDGQQAPFTNLNLSYADFPVFTAGSGTSNANGAWEEPFGRVPMILQPGVDLLLNGCFQFAGTHLVETFPSGPVNFSGPETTVNCTMVTGDATQFTHLATPLGMSMLPGDIGGLSPELSPQLGLGYGVQFPVVPLAGPTVLPLDFAPMQLFKGGLLLGVNGGRILSGMDQTGFDQCIECRDFGPGAVGSVEDLGGGNRKITWTYDDSHSSEAAGISVLQESFDGAAGATYVLVRFALTNNSGHRLRLDPGLFMDWDIDGDPLGERGNVALNGQLVYETTQQGGTSMGTMMFVGGPSRGVYFVPFRSSPFSVADQIAFLRGKVRRHHEESGDTRYFQGGSAVSLEAGATKDVWIAIVGGVSVADLVANGTLAAQDVANRQAGSLRAVSGRSLSGIRVPSVRPSSTGMVPPGCKRSCAGTE